MSIVPSTLEFNRPVDLGELNNLRYPIIGEPKLDGVRGMLTQNPQERFITTRNRDSEGAYHRVDSKLPQFANLEWGDFIIDGELMVPVVDNSLGITTGILNATPDNALNMQIQDAEVNLYAFDLLSIDYVDLREDNIEYRRRVLEDVVSELNHPNLKIIRRQVINDEHEAEAFILSMLEGGFEGVVFKDCESTYNQKNSWRRFKERVTVDAQVIGYTEGKGKYTGLIGAVELALIQDGHGLRSIGNCAPGTDDVRVALSRKLINASRMDILEMRMIAEVEAQSWTPHGKLRHPRIKRWRPDRSEPNTRRF